MVIKCNKQYRIKKFDAWPHHWADDMHLRQGQVMTIRRIVEKQIYCKESGDYFWYASDFESIETDWDE